jgi:UDP-N-acetylmuramate--alanine ligase
MRSVHFVGVGGIGMSGLAEILLNLGYEVSGSDVVPSAITRRLEGLGLLFSEGHRAENVGDAEILVVSAAVAEENDEIRNARERGIPVMHRSELLADLMRLKPNAVAVGGTHGKTTTTSMISSILDGANIGATSIVGGILHRSGTNARWGTGEYLVAEADEHDGSFLHLHPTIAVVTNIDAEHLEYYGTIDQIKRAFTEFCNGVPFYGYAILCGDDGHCADILPDVHSVAVTYGLREGMSLQAQNIRLAEQPAGGTAQRLGEIATCFDVVCHDARIAPLGLLGTVTFHALGENNVRNALAACAVGLCLGMRFGLLAEGLRHFDGVRRRLQVCGEAGGVVVVEDYAHHPTEIASTLEAIRWLKPRRLIGVFQPHLYSRTKHFCDDFASVLAEFDRAIVTDIYASRELPMPGVDAGMVVDVAHAQGARYVELVRDMHAVPECLNGFVEPGDMVLILGAGDINQIAAPLLKTLGAD